MQMKVWVGLGLLATAVVYSPGCSQQADMAAWDPATIAAEMERLGKPGPEHEWMAKGVGEWKVVVTNYCDPEKGPVVTGGHATIKSIFGGRFLEEEFHGIYEGRPFEGRGYSGYDRMIGKFVFTWFSDDCTSLTVLRGNFIDGTKDIEAHGMMSMPCGSEVPLRSVTKEIDDDTRQFIMYSKMSPHGEETKMMEMTYSRIK